MEEVIRALNIRPGTGSGCHSWTVDGSGLLVIVVKRSP
jgi:hypothetical protein